MLPLTMRLVWTLPPIYTAIDVFEVTYTVVRMDAAPYNAVGVDVAFLLCCDWCVCGPLFCCRGGCCHFYCC